jgi:hypothetical protein
MSKNSYSYSSGYSGFSSSFSHTPLTTTGPSLSSWSPTYAGANVDHAVGSAVSLAFSSISEANHNKQTAINTAIRTGNASLLPIGSYSLGGNVTTEGYSPACKVIRGDGYVRYEYPSGTYVVKTDDGFTDTGVGSGW